MCAEQMPGWDDDVESLLRLVDGSGAIAEQREAVSGLTRGTMLRRAVLIGTAGAAAATAPARAAERNQRDKTILNFALGLEYLQAAFYTEAQRRGALTGRVAQQARIIGGHERVHVRALREQLGAHAISRPTFDFHGATEGAETYRDTAVALEDLTVAAYQAQAPRITSRGYLVAAVGIQSAEARHAAWVRHLAGVLPANHAFDEPVSSTHARALVKATGFVAKPTQTTARTRPKFTG